MKEPPSGMPGGGFFVRAKHGERFRNPAVTRAAQDLSRQGSRQGTKRMIQSERGSNRFEQEARRCERLCLAVYDPALSSQLLRLASEYRARAERLRDERAA